MSLAAGVVALAFNYWKELDNTGESRLWLRNWVIRGLMVPIVCWMVFVSGLIGGFFSLFPELDNLKGLVWLAVYQKKCALGIAAISTYWAAATLISLLVGVAYCV